MICNFCNNPVECQPSLTPITQGQVTCSRCGLEELEGGLDYLDEEDSYNRAQFLGSYRERVA